jgi:hypothetical protein
LDAITSVAKSGHAWHLMSAIHKRNDPTQDPESIPLPALAAEEKKKFLRSPYSGFGERFIKPLTDLLDQMALCHEWASDIKTRYRLKALLDILVAELGTVISEARSREPRSSSKLAHIWKIMGYDKLKTQKEKEYFKNKELFINHKLYSQIHPDVRHEPMFDSKIMGALFAALPQREDPITVRDWIRLLERKGLINACDESEIFKKIKDKLQWLEKHPHLKINPDFKINADLYSDLEGSVFSKLDPDIQCIVIAKVMKREIPAIKNNPIISEENPMARLTNTLQNLMARDPLVIHQLTDMLQNLIARDPLVIHQMNIGQGSAGNDDGLEIKSRYSSSPVSPGKFQPS